MSLLDSLLDAIIRLGGDALVMHVGERPYVVTQSSALDSFRGPLSWGQVELSSRPLTPDAVLSMLNQMLPPEVRHALDDIGAVEHEIASPDGEHRFMVVAARGGDDVWVEVRKKAPPPLVVEAPAVQGGEAETFAPASEVPAETPEMAEVVDAAGDPSSVEGEEGQATPEPLILAAAAEVVSAEPEPVLHLDAGELGDPQEWFALEPVVTPRFEAPPVPAELPEIELSGTLEAIAEPIAEEVPEPLGEPVFEPAAEEIHEPVVEPVPEPVAEEVPEPIAEPVFEPAAEEIHEPAVAVFPPAAAAAPPVMRLQPRDPAPISTSAVSEVLCDGLERGAATVYAIAGSRPLMRIDGEIISVASLPVLQPADLDRFAFEFGSRGEVAHATAEWTATVPGAGRVRCVSFEDAAGRGLVFHLAANVSSADHLGLSREIQALCNEPDGLVIVAGPRASGKSTLLSAFVDRINRTRADHVITIESRVRTLHEHRHALISQREVDGDGAAIARAARAALREGPDVLVLDDARAPETIAVAIDAARAGRLVFASLPAPSAAAAVERLADAFPVDRRPQVRALLSGALRAVISQVLVPAAGGGRVGAREVLLSSPPVAQLILDGAYAQVPVAIEGGRRLGMRTLTDSLVAHVRDGGVEPAAAIAAAPDRRALIAALQQEGIDVSELERFA